MDSHAGWVATLVASRLRISSALTEIVIGIVAAAIGQAPHHAEKKHPVALEIVDEAAGAHEEAHVLLAGRRGTDHGPRV